MINISNFFSNTTSLESIFTSVAPSTSLPITTYASSGLSTGFYAYVNGVKYDLSTIYQPSPSIESPSTNVNMYSTINGQKYDLSRLFQ